MRRTIIRRLIQGMNTATRHPQRATPRLTLTLALMPIAVTTVGCAQFNSPTDPIGSPMIQVPDRQPELTPRQRSERYHEASARGAQLASRGQYALAIDYFQEAVDLNPNSIEAWFNLAACREQTGDPFGAMDVYRRILAIHPDDADCYANLGTCSIKLYHRERNPAWRVMAIQSWRRSLDLNPRQPDLRRYLASCRDDSDG